MVDPLSPQQVDALLRPDPRSTAADMLVLRDALLRLGDAWERLADAAGALHDVAEEIARERRIDPPPIPPRAD
jgi:hypothetical protein